MQLTFKVDDCPCDCGVACPGWPGCGEAPRFSALLTAGLAIDCWRGGGTSGDGPAGLGVICVVGGCFSVGVWLFSDPHPAPPVGTRFTVGSLPLLSLFRLGKWAGGGIRLALATLPKLCNPWPREETINRNTNNKREQNFSDNDSKPMAYSYQSGYSGLKRVCVIVANCGKW